MKIINIFLITIIFFLNIIHSRSQLETVVRFSAQSTNDNDEAFDVCFDFDLNMYVTGKGWHSTQDFNIYTNKYNKNGNLLWSRSYNGVSNKADQGNSVIVDSDGNIYVAGSTMASNNRKDFIVLKYSPSGSLLWSHIYNGSADSDDEAKDLLWDYLGNIYVTGYAGNSSTSSDFCTIKLTETGNLLWRKFYNSGVDVSKKIVLDWDFNIIVTGKSTFYAANDDFATIKYSQSGDSIWVKRYAGSGSDEPFDIDVDRFNNVYVSGRTPGNNYDFNFCLIKYNAAGQQQWIRTYNGPANDEDEIYSAAIDTIGNIFVTGTSVVSGQGYNIITQKYNPSGTILWTATQNGSANQNDAAYGIEIDQNGDVYVGGKIQVEWSYSATDYCTIKYNGLNGSQVWAKTYNGPGNGGDYINSLYADYYGNVVVAGISRGTTTGGDYCIIKYLQAPFAPLNLSANSISSSEIYIECIPNSNNHTTFEYQYSTDGGVTWPQSILGYNSYDTVSFLLPNTIYYFRARVNNQVGYSPFSNIAFDTTFWPVGIITINNEMPKQFNLSQNYPNPFNPVTNITFDLPKESTVKLTVYDALGKEVIVLVNQNLQAGSYKADWNASDYPSGIYFYKLEAGSFVETKKMILKK